MNTDTTRHIQEAVTRLREGTATDEDVSDVTTYIEAVDGVIAMVNDIVEAADTTTTE